MRPLIDDIRLLDGKTTINNDQEVLSGSLNISQEIKQETPAELQEVDFQRFSETEKFAPRRVNNFFYLKDDGFLQDKQKQNRLKDFIKVDDLMDGLNEEPIEEQRQRSIIKDYKLKI